MRELGLSNCRLHLPSIKADAIPPFDGCECRSVVVLKISGAQVSFTLVAAPLRDFDHIFNTNEFLSTGDFSRSSYFTGSATASISQRFSVSA